MSGPEVGWSLAVGHRGEVVHTECTGPHTPETKFDIASTSKQFTALAVLLTLDLDEEVWHLLHHQSGLADYVELLLAAGHDYLERTTMDDALALIDGAPLDFEPGTDWGYSNTNYLLLGERVAAALGRPLPEVLETLIFEPLGLEMVMDPLGRVEPRATSFDPEGAPADSLWEQIGDGVMWTTPSELVRWADIYSTAAFGQDVLAQQLRAVPDGTGTSYGAGIWVLESEGRTLLEHGGDWSGFESAFTVDPEARVAVALCANQPGLITDEQGIALVHEWRQRLT